MRANHKVNAFDWISVDFMTDEMNVIPGVFQLYQLAYFYRDVRVISTGVVWLTRLASTWPPWEFAESAASGSVACKEGLADGIRDGQGSLHGPAMVSGPRDARQEVSQRVDLGAEQGSLGAKVLVLRDLHERGECKEG